jgi:hypothetical protein
MAKPRPYGLGPYGAGPYERNRGPWMKPAGCEPGTWTPVVFGETAETSVQLSTAVYQASIDLPYSRGASR